MVTETDLFHSGDREGRLDNLFLKNSFSSTTGDRSSKWPNLISVPLADTKQGSGTSPESLSKVMDLNKCRGNKVIRPEQSDPSNRIRRRQALRGKIGPGP